MTLQNKQEHILSRKWTLWFYNPNTAKSNKNWLELLQKVYTIDSIENFWRIYNNIQTPSTLKLKTNYFLFADGVDPEWENDANRNGGKWTVEFDSKNKNCNVDHYWLYTLLSITGASLPASEHVLGIQIAIKFNKYRLSIWTDDALDKINNLKIGNAIRNLWELDNKIKMSYIPHDVNIKLTYTSLDSAHSDKAHSEMAHSEMAYVLYTA